MATPYVKHGTQNILNECRQWLSDSFIECTKFLFWPGLCPRPHWGSFQRSTGLPGWFKVGGGQKGEEKRKEEGSAPLTQIDWTVRLDCRCVFFVIRMSGISARHFERWRRLICDFVAVCVVRRRRSCGHTSQRRRHIVGRQLITEPHSSETPT